MAPPTHPLDDDVPSGPPSPVGGEHAEELELVRLVLSGSEDAWRRFLTRYSGLIHAMIRRYMAPRDRDDVSDVYADVLESLIRSRLALYEGRASLSTWLTMVTRSRVLDHLRCRFGRRHPPAALRRLSPTDREIFRLYYIEGQAFGDVLRALRMNGAAWDQMRLVSALQRIESRIGSRWMRRLAYDLHAQSVGAASGRLLAYLDHVREEFKLNEGAHGPEYHLMEREAQVVVDHLHRSLATLSPKDREIITMRFERGWPARRIAEELGLSGQRAAYTLLDRILRVLRRRMGKFEERRP